MKRPGGFDRPPAQEEPAAPRVRRSWLRRARAEVVDSVAEPSEVAEPSAAVESARVVESAGVAAVDSLAQAAGQDTDAAALALQETRDLTAEQLAAATASAVEVTSTAETAVEDAAPAGGVAALVRRWGSGSASGVAAAKRKLRLAEREARQRERRDSRRFRAGARRTRRVWLISGAAVAALALFVGIGTFTPVMSVRQIEIAGASRVDVQQLQNSLSRFEGEPIALVSSSAVAKVLQDFTLIESYAIEVRPPKTLYVQIVERTPVIVVAEGDTFLQYDAAGVLLAQGADPVAGLPVAQGQVRNVQSKSFAAAAKVLRNVPAELRSQFVEVSALSPQSIQFTLASGAQIVWGDTGDTQRKAVVLQTMMNALAGRGFTLLDVSSPGAPVFK